jgi:hypothetical protein
MRRNSLLGFAKIRFGSGVIIGDVACHHAGSRLWASPPSMPWVKAGQLVIDEATGKPKYFPIISFERTAFSARGPSKCCGPSGLSPKALRATEDDSDSMEAAEALQWQRRERGAA